MINLSNDVEFRVKWAGPNTPYIEFDTDGVENRIFLSKADLKAVRNEISNFMTFYGDSFTKERINDEDDFSEEGHDA